LAHMTGKTEQAPAGFAFSRYKGTDEVAWEANARVVLGLDKKPAKSPTKSPSARTPRVPRDDKQIALFALEAA
jgi:DNA (cytosine-5)-methyltransferase 1